MMKRVFVASLLLVAALAIAFRHTIIHSYEVRRLAARREAMFAALPYRPANFRFSGQRIYRPVRHVASRASTTAATPADLTLRAEATSLLAANVNDNSAKANRDRAVAAFLAGDRDRSLRIIQAARSNDPAFLDDAAAIYDASADVSGRATLRVMALVAASRARNHSPQDQDALWNYASAIESIGLVAEARVAWRQYIDLDPNSEWAAEARGRLRALDAPTDEEAWTAAAATLEKSATTGPIESIAEVASRFPFRVRLVVKRRWIPSWGASVRNHDPGADQMLRAIDVASNAIARSTTDLMLADFVAAARRNASGKEFAAAHARIADIGAILRSRGTEAAIREFENVNLDLRRVGSPLAAEMEADLASFLYNAGAYERALEEVDQADAHIDPARYPFAAALAQWNRGVSAASLGRTGPAAAAYRQSLSFYRRTGDLTAAVMIPLLLGDNAELTNNPEETWRRYLEAIDQVERRGEAERDLVVLDRIAAVALKEGHLEVASILSDAVISRARDDRFRPYRCHALVTRCDVSAKLGHSAEAARSCQAARATFASIADAAVRDRLESDLDLAGAGLQKGPARIDALTRAVSAAESRRDVFRVARVLHARARAYIEDGTPQLARADLESALDQIEDQRQRLESTAEKLSFFETSREIADQLVKVLVESSEPEAALAVADRVRARILLEGMTGSSAAPRISSDELRRHVAKDEALIEYWSGPGELYIWVVRSGSISFFRRPISRNALAEAARAFSDSIVQRVDTPSLARTSELLLPPSESLAGARSLTVIPDGPIALLPFAALRDAGGMFVIQRFEVTQSPSAAAHAAVAAAAPRESVLLLANPATNDSLPQLDVRGEISHAVRAIRRAAVYQREEATAAVLRSSGSRFDVVHIAAHGFDDSPAGEPAIALAPERPGDAGLVIASDIASMRLRRSSLVVLAACRGGSGRTSLEGTMSLARAFAGAGARTVVAALWDAEDADAGPFFSAFYSALAAGASPAAALREAQLSFIRNGPVSHPRHWAAYQLYGGA